ncbi:MAG: neutral zinc metallopeptidase [Candidatus Microthrix subdominans]|jgi:predicted metalloprotease|uniref:neutral zinc metallopeptidase n=1 Tax=Candidatus Neomicrothrix sp. TaxID=2719034 RepID=UPI0025925C67|nr:neutral zinc metallopeptidase [Candidatus Microthrix sp.]HMS46538.1 neutral zinc metallopeptidase [Candidatus Microthrix sp.]
MKNRLIMLIVLTAMVGAACSTGLVAESADVKPGAIVIDRTDRPEQPTRPAEGENARPYLETVDLSIADIQDFWSNQMPKAFGQEFQKIPTSKIFAYNSATPPPACGPGEQPSYEALAGNAFYCSEEQFIAFDDENLFPQLYEKYGSYGVAMVLAHEWGHAVQDQLGLADGSKPTVFLEQQSDCFAGAWTKWVDDGNSDNLSLSEGSLDAALGGMLAFRDEPGTRPDDPAAHGSGFDRVRAFRDGFTSGVKACADYVTNPPELTQLPFRTEGEYRTGGNLDYGQLIKLLVPDFDLWMTREFPSFEALSTAVGFDPSAGDVSCGDTKLSGADATGKIFYCASDNSIRWDEPWLAGINDESGDFATGLLLGMQYGVALQSQTGMSDDDIGSEDSIKQRACLVGAYSGSLIDESANPTGSRELSISGGDLDEALASLISLSASKQVDESGSSLAFDRIEAFQNGVLDGVNSCGIGG